MNQNPKDENIFSLATLLYARLRKVNSRVIDVAYFMQEPNYALHVIELALNTHDEELHGYANRLKNAFGFVDDTEIIQSTESKSKKPSEEEGHISFSLF